MTIDRDLEILDRNMAYIISCFTMPDLKYMIYTMDLIAKSMGYKISVKIDPYNAIEEYKISDENRILIKKNRRDIRL